MNQLITNARTGTHAPATHSPGPWHAQGRYIVPLGDGPSIGHATILKAPSLKKQPALPPCILPMLQRIIPNIYN